MWRGGEERGGMGGGGLWMEEVVRSECIGSVEEQH